MVADRLNNLNKITSFVGAMHPETPRAKAVLGVDELIHHRSGTPLPLSAPGYFSSYALVLPQSAINDILDHATDQKVARAYENVFPRTIAPPNEKAGRSGLDNSGYRDHVVAWLAEGLNRAKAARDAGKSEQEAVALSGLLDGSGPISKDEALSILVQFTLRSRLSGAIDLNAKVGRDNIKETLVLNPGLSQETKSLKQRLDKQGPPPPNKD